MDVYHTDTDSHGAVQPMGHVDVYFEGGEDQVYSVTDFIDHQRAHELFLQSILAPCTLVARRCTPAVPGTVVPRQDFAAFYAQSCSATGAVNAGMAMPSSAQGVMYAASNPAMSECLDGNVNPADPDPGANTCGTRDPTPEELDTVDQALRQPGPGRRAVSLADQPPFDFLLLPVVFHVYHDGDTGKLSAAQCNEFIAQANKASNRTHACGGDDDDDDGDGNSILQ